ncbi:MAG: hypothetical protein EOO40_01730 [Deltaproteobacteria bacterium]|nr:MAG: hypothetical protein EOO40_01730 [Deltaproteobacteria bacterium]
MKNEQATASPKAASAHASELQDAVLQQVQALSTFEVGVTAPTRSWACGQGQAHYWGQLDDRRRPHGRGVFFADGYKDDGALQTCLLGTFWRGESRSALPFWQPLRDLAYEGDLQHGRRHGFGRLYNAVGSRLIYEGTFHNQRPHGYGSWHDEDGTTYSGWFRRGRRHGLGSWLTAEGTRSVGRHRRGRPTLPYRSVLSGDRGVWLGTVVGADPVGEGTLLGRGMPMQGRADRLVAKHAALPSPAAMVVDAAGVARVCIHSQLGEVHVDALRALQAALVGGQGGPVQAALRTLQPLPLAAARTLLQKTDRFGYTALHTAVRHGGDAHVVRALLGLGADVHACDPRGVQPIHLACGYSAATRQACEAIYCDEQFFSLYLARRLPGPNEVRWLRTPNVAQDYRRGLRWLSPRLAIDLLEAGAEPQMGVESVMTLPRAAASRFYPRANVAISAFEIAVLSGDQVLVRTLLIEHSALRNNLTLGRTGQLLAQAIVDPSMAELIAELQTSPPSGVGLAG